MLKPVHHDKQRELLVAKRVLADRIRSFQDDKAEGWALTGSPIAPPIRLLTALEMTREEGR